MSPRDKELLTMLAEEAAELVQACTKALRHGLDSFNPEDPGGVTNRANLRREFTDVLAVARMIDETGGPVLWPTTGQIREAMGRKDRYRHHRPPPLEPYK